LAIGGGPQEWRMNEYQAYTTGRCYAPLKGKVAYLPDWPKNPVKLDQIPENENIGLLLEHAGLVDVDMDSPEAQYTGRVFLPTETLAAGRGGKIRRYLYEGTTPNRTFTDLTGDVLLEVRHKGKQTMWAGSIHPDTGESIEVMRDVRPLSLPDEENIYKAATSALIARHLPAGGRHELAMAYSGFCCGRVSPNRRPSMCSGRRGSSTVRRMMPTGTYGRSSPTRRR
jgi:hypothetical protein